MNPRIFLLLCGCGGLVLCPVASGRGSLQAAEAVPVSVSRPVAREVTDYVELTGRTQAVSVNVVARVSGYLVGTPIKEGSDVKAGDLLVEIDPRPYQAQYDMALSKVNLQKAQLKLAQVTLERDGLLARNTPGSVGAQQLDQDHAAIDHAEAQIKAAETGLETCKLKLDSCKVSSPIDGLASRLNQSVGSLVTEDQTVLTSVVSLDPIYAYVDVDEATVLRVRRAINEGRIKPDAAGRFPVLMAVQGEKGFPHKGVVDFSNGQVNPTTGTVLARGVFANPLPQGGRRLLMPGMFVRVRLPIGQPHKALLVIDRAIASDQEEKYVYVVDARGEIERKPVEIGPLESDGLRVVTKGLDAGDQVVVSAYGRSIPA